MIWRLDTSTFSRADGKAVLLARRFDRAGATRIPFLSAMSMTGSTDGQAGSYPEIVDALAQHGSDAKADALGLYRRMVFNVMVSDVDDHLRNHGFLWSGRSGWVLSPVYDLNPTPVDLKARILTTNISLTEGICSVDLLIEVAGFFGFDADRATSIIGEVAAATSTWRSVAAEVGATSAEIDRMTSAFEHDDLDRAFVSSPSASTHESGGRRVSQLVCGAAVAHEPSSVQTDDTAQGPTHSCLGKALCRRALVRSVDLPGWRRITDQSWHARCLMTLPRDEVRLLNHGA